MTWVVIKDFNYSIKENGLVRNNLTHKLIKPRISSSGYIRVTLSRNGLKYDKHIHLLLAEAFIPKPISNKKLEVNHKDGNKLNFNLLNLEWLTHKENIKHAWDNGIATPKSYPGIKSGKTKLTDSDVKEIRRLFSRKLYSIKDLSIMYKIGYSGLRRIVRRESWSHLD